ncbi:MAG: hypothetical protein LBK53_04440 [Heliobacteriaceae bacterium]|jgi:hypothetical protein|nr:hypothetical protein [Heliobacteriaceae bacterium]
MILSAFSKYLQKHDSEIIENKTSAVKLLCDWVRLVVHKNPKQHVDKIVHAEIMLAENTGGDFLITGKSESGRVLVKALYNFAMSYENYLMSRWLADKKADDFNS